MMRAGIVLLALNAVAFGDTFTFSTDPLAGTIARSVPERLLIGGEQFIPFNLAKDVFAFAPVVLGGDTQIDFADGPVNALPHAANVVVLQTLDDDNNPLTPFGAFQAADLISSRITDHGPGVFIFFNQDLGLPELIYSDDLASNQADLRVLARMISLNGQFGIDSLPRFSTTNFTIATDSPSAVPEPSSLAMLCGGVVLVAVGAVRKRNRALHGLIVLKHTTLLGPSTRRHISRLWGIPAKDQICS
jgi:hypothetical protein